MVYYQHVMVFLTLSITPAPQPTLVIHPTLQTLQYTPLRPIYFFSFNVHW